MSDKPSLKTRVNQFLTMQLPGQPMMMHMGTSYLVQDLWNTLNNLADEIDELRLCSHEYEVDIAEYIRDKLEASE
jgi:hypothetical protein